MKIDCAYDELVDLHKLIPNPKNNNRHSEEQIKRLSQIIDFQGMRSPIVVSKRSGYMTKGHARLEALKLLEWTQAPVDYQEYESEAQEYADMTADNEIARWAELDMSKLIDDVKEMNFDEADVKMLGIEDFQMPEEVAPANTDEDSVPDVMPDPITKRGDVWLLGNHRVMCGDSTMIGDVDKLMNGEKADMVFTDPPYNIDYSNADRPKPGARDFGKIRNDTMSVESFGKFINDILCNLYIVSKEDCSLYFWYASASASASAILISFDDSEWKRNQEIIWKKPMLLGRGRYQWAHEPCIFAIKGKPWFTDDRTKTTVWDFGGYDKSKNMHPTQKPVFLPEEAIGNSSKIGSNILDLFLGSGSTLIACEKTNRKCFGMELDEKYCDVIVKRYQEYTGKEATLEHSGETFNSMVK